MRRNLYGMGVVAAVGAIGIMGLAYPPSARAEEEKNPYGSKKPAEAQNASAADVAPEQLSAKPKGGDLPPAIAPEMMKAATQKVTRRTPAPNEAEAPQKQIEQAAPIDPPAMLTPILDANSSKISFQVYLTDGGGSPLPDGVKGLDFFVYANPAGGAPLGVDLNVPVNTVDGVGNAQIGPFASGLFTGAARYLGFTVDDNDDNPVGDELSPRLLMASVPHALRVDRVESEELTDNVELGGASASGSAVAYNAAGTVVAEMSGPNGGFRAFGTDGNLRARLYGFTWGSLLLYDNTSQTNTVQLNAQSNSGGQLILDNTDGAQRIELEGDLNGGRIDLSGTTGGLNARFDGELGSVAVEGGYFINETIGGSLWGAWTGFADGDGDEGSVLYSYNEAGTTMLEAGAAAAWGGYLTAYQEDGDTGVVVDGDWGLFGANGGGAVSIWTAEEDLAIWAVAGANEGDLFIYGANNDLTVTIDGGDAAVYAEGGFSAVDSIGGTTLASVASQIWGGRIHTYDENGTFSTQMGASAGSGGFMNIRQTNGNVSINMDGDDNNANGGGIISLYQSNGSTIGINIDGDNGNATNGGAISLRQANGSNGVFIDGDEGGANGGGEINVYNIAGTRTIEIDGAWNAGTEGRIRTDVLEIEGGADLSEQFDVKGDHQPGMVVCINPDEPGKLIVSSSPYDYTVAGIIAGAGGVKPGMLMRHAGTLASGSEAVALTGRVYCWVDATEVPVRPGDMLTTSSTPGHAMRVTDHAKAQGAILGKAMTGLTEGHGLVLVLVTLQ